LGQRQLAKRSPFAERGWSELEKMQVKEKLMANRKQCGDSIKTEVMDCRSNHLISSRFVWLKVKDVMTKETITIASNETGGSAAKVMSENEVTCILVVDNGNVVGIVTVKDFLTKIVNKDWGWDQMAVAEMMSRPVECISPDSSVFDAIAIMEAKNIKRLPVVTGKRLLGIVTQTDLIRSLTTYCIWKDVAQIMNSAVAVVQTKATVAEAVQIMSSRDISCTVVLEGDEIKGIITEKDILKRVIGPQKDPAHINVEEVMSSPVTTIPSHHSVFSAYKTMDEMHVHRLVITDNEQLCGIVTQTDILRTAKKKLQEEMEEDFQLLGCSKSNIYALDSDGKITYVNPAFMKLLEISDPAELINEPFLPEKYCGNQEERTSCLIELMKGNVEIEELALRTCNGREIYVSILSTFTMDIHGQVNGTRGVLYDITNRKKAEKALRESEARYRTLYESSRDAIMMLAPPTWKFVAGNKATLELFGARNEEEFITKGPWDVSPEYQPDGQLSSEKAKDMIEKAMKEGSNFLEWQHMKLDGKEFFATILLARIDLEGRELLQATVRDITEYKQTLESLSKSETKYRTLIDNIPQKVFMKDLNSVYVSCNESYAESLKIKSSDIVGKTDYDFFPKELAEKYRTDDKRIIELEKTESIDEKFVLDGKEIIVNTVKSPVKDEQGNITSLLGIFWDITDRKRAEDTVKTAYEQLERSHRELKEMQCQLVQNEKLASIGQLAAGVAHEMNTPVGFVASNFQTLENYVKKIRDLLITYDELIGQIETLGKTELRNKVEGIGQFRDDLQIDFILEDIRGLFDESREGLERVTSIIQNLRDFSRIDRPGSRDEYDINKGIEATLVVVKNEIKYDADVRTEFSEVPLVFCHSGQINQVFLNILVNAAQAIKSQERDGNGAITIRTYATETEIVCEIADDGPGIAPDNLSRVFEPFFTTKPTGKGTGLGLSISYDIVVNKHHGEFFVESTVGEGTKFTIKLPIGTKENEEQEIISDGKKNSIICG